MARSRNIKPGFFKNEYLGELSFEVRLLFIGLWCLADREGRLEDRPKRIKVEVFPMDSVDVDPMLNELQANDFVIRYEAEGKRYIQIINFVKHQNPHYREVASEIPPPDGETNQIIATNITRTQRARILERDNYTCQHCGSTENLCIDHVLPVSRGGTSEDENLQVLCSSCNTRKGNKLSADVNPNLNRSRPDVEPKQSQDVTLIPDSFNLIPDSFNPIKETPPKKLKKEKPQKTSYSEFVLLTNEEYSKLVNEFGEKEAQEIISILNNYKGATGKQYKSDYLAIKNWVIERWMEKQQKENMKGGKEHAVFRRDTEQRSLTPEEQRFFGITTAD